MYKIALSLIQSNLGMYKIYLSFYIWTSDAQILVRSILEISDRKENAFLKTSVFSVMRFYCFSYIHISI